MKPGSIVKNMIILLIISSCSKRGEFLSQLEVKVNGVDGEPIGGAYVFGGADWDLFSGSTDDEGRVTFWLKPRKYEVFAQKTNYFTEWGLISLDPFEKNYIELTLSPTRGEVISITSIPTGGTIIKMIPWDKYLWAIVYQGKLEKWDVSKPSEPYIENTYFLTSPLKDFVMKYPYIFYTSGERGVWIADISMEPPAILDSIDTDGVATGIALFDTLLFIGNSVPPGGIYIYSIRIPEDPLFISKVENIMANSMVVEFPYLFIIGERCGPCIMDISDPHNPSLFVKQEAFGWDIEIFGERVYIALPDRIESWSLNDPTSPLRVYSTQGVEKIFVTGLDSLLLGSVGGEGKASLLWVTLGNEIEIYGTYFEGYRIWPLIEVEDYFYLLREEDYLDIVKFLWVRGEGRR
jgi:hypothetical protein